MKAETAGILIASPVIYAILRSVPWTIGCMLVAFVIGWLLEIAVHRGWIK